MKFSANYKKRKIMKIKSPLTPPKGGELFVFSSPLGEVGRGFKYPFKTSPHPS